MSWGHLSRDAPSLATEQRPRPLVPAFPEASTGSASCSPPRTPRPAPGACPRLSSLHTLALIPSARPRRPPQPGAHPCPPSSVIRLGCPPAPILVSQTLTHTHVLTHTHSDMHACARTQPYRKVAINPMAQASSQSRDHISKVREAGEQEAVRVRFGGWSRKEEISCKRQKENEVACFRPLTAQRNGTQASRPPSHRQVGWGSPPHPIRSGGCSPATGGRTLWPCRGQDWISAPGRAWAGCAIKVLRDKQRLRTRHRPTPCLPEGPVGASQGSPKSL